MSESKLNTLPTHIKRNWVWLLGLGMLLVILGCIGIAMVIGLTVASILFMGILFILAGAAQIVDTCKSKHWKGAAWHALIAILYIIVGGLVIYDPILASTIVTALIAWMLILIGISRITMGIMLKQIADWGWMIVAGVIAIVLGVLILMQWPMSALWVIGMFIAIELMINGWNYIFLAFAIRQAQP